MSARFLLLFVMLTTVASAQGRILIVGVDGMDHQLTSQWLRGGELPALKALSEQGEFVSLRPTNPAQSPTSWASLTTGLNPGAHGIQGFLRAEIEDGRVVPTLSMARKVDRPVLTGGVRALGYLAAFALGALPIWFLRRRPRWAAMVSCGVGAMLLLAVRWMFANIPESIPAPENLRSGDALWEALDREGVKVVSLGAPCAFPAPDLEHGHLLCGLGVPDLEGTPGTWSLWRAGPVPGGGRLTQMGGKEVTLRREPGQERIEGLRIVGPVDPLGDERLVIPVEVKVDGAAVVLDVQGQQVRLEEGRFSELVPVSFSWGELGAAVHGTLRFRLQQLEPHVVLLLKPVNIDPARQAPFARVTSGADYGAALKDRGGAFETLGWATATNPYQDELIDDETLLEDARALMDRRVTMTMNAAVRDDWRVLLTVLSTPDRLQHMFWRDMDKSHPAHDEEEAERRGDVILESYRKVDALVGRLRDEVMKPGDVLLVVSDHGFAPFRYAVNLNRWLAEQGWLVARSDGERTLARHLNGSAAFAHVDWSQTKAFNLGLGRIWLNTKERFGDRGIVTAEGAPELKREIRARLLKLRDGDKRVIRSVRRAKDIYRGARLSESAELIVGFHRGYRVSWNACLGGIDEPLLFANRTRWSGDHCSVDPDLVPGVLFSTVDLGEGAADVTDIYPTLRDLLGLPPADGLDGRSLLEGR